jgi:hypothetical protein
MPFANLTSLLELLKAAMTAPSPALDTKYTKIESDIMYPYIRRDWRALRRIAQLGDSMAGLVADLVAGLPAATLSQTVLAFLNSVSDTAVLEVLPGRLRNVTIDRVLNCTSADLLRRRRR